MSELIGRTLAGQYRVETYVASGGMGTVFRVWDLKRNTWLAMKLLHEDLADDPAMFKRFRREARALEKLAHPNIVPFYGLEQAEELVFLLERFIDGPSLKRLLRMRGGQPLPIQEALTYLRALSSALSYAHANGVVHCDVKPGNVMVDRGGGIYLTDFGIARHAESTTTTFASSGTPGYMAPEQIRGEAVTPATDIYALGVLTFELLTGQRPFSGPESGADSDPKGAGVTGAERIRRAHLEQPPPDPRQLNPAIPVGLAAVVLRALAKEPERRYASAQAFYQALLQGAGLAEAGVPERARVAEGERPAPQARRPEPPAGRIGRQRSRLMGGGALIFGLVVVVLVGMGLLRSLAPAPAQRAEADRVGTAAAATVTARMAEVLFPTTPAAVERTTETATLTPWATLTPAPPTKTPTGEPVTSADPPSPAPQPARLLLINPSFCRGSPDYAADKIWSFTAGTELAIVGQDGDWWLVQFNDPRTRHDRCWIHTENGATSGDLGDVPYSDYRTYKQ